MTERIEKLVEAFKATDHARFRVEKELTILTDKTVEGRPLVVRKALALAHVVDETAAVVMDHELLVGLRTAYGSLREQELETGLSWDAPHKPAVFKGMTRKLRCCPSYLTEAESAEAAKEGLFEGSSTSHVPFGVQKVLTHGYDGIKRDAMRRIEELDSGNGNASKKAFLKAVILVMEAASRFVLRHADEAERQAKAVSDPGRRHELGRIASNCRWVAHHAPRGFHEALQLFWLSYLITEIENGGCLPVGHFDQDLYPFYRADLAAGITSRQEAEELLACLWIKLNFEDDLVSDTCRNLTLAGVDSQGRDVTNELTYLCLEVSLALKLPDPKINVRFHRDSPAELWTTCCRIAVAGVGGLPSFYNDTAVIACLQKAGIPLEDARLYCADGCQELIVPGKGDFYPTFISVDFLACVLQMPANDGEATSFEAVMERYKQELGSAIERAVAAGNKKDSALARFSPVPFLSSTLQGCMESGRDKTQGGTVYNYSGCIGRAFANAVNSLTVLKKLVYEDRQVLPSTMNEALAKNWEGYEPLRQSALNAVPKYGNDDDYADSVAEEVAAHFIRKVLEHGNPRGGRYYPGIFTFGHVTQGQRTGASPDGRKAGDTITAHITPAVGTDLSGPTAVANSAARVCRLQPPEGTALDIRLHPSAVRGESGRRNLLALIEAFMAQGGIQVQLNIVDSETLRQAQQNPDEHKGLIVRVWGFSAYFVQLTKDYQEEIIARTAHGF